MIPKLTVDFWQKCRIRQPRSTSKITERQVLDIRMETKAFLTTLLAKLLLQAPVNHLLVRKMHCLDPRLMVSKKKLCVEKIKGVLHTLVAASQVRASICDKALREFREFLDVAVASFRIHV